MTKPDVTVVGYLALDSIVCPAGRFEDVPGGAALYSAAAVALTGARVVLVARVGAGFPASILERLEALGVCLEHLVSDDHPCPRSRLIDPSGRDRASPHHRDPDWWAAQRRLAPPIAPAGAGVFVFNAMPAAALAAQIDSRRSGERLVIDTSAAFVSVEGAAIATQARRATLFAPSREETRLLFPELDDTAALAGLSELLPVAVQKRGADGLALRRRGVAELRQPSSAGAIVDTTGAGDSVVGALGASLARNLPDAAMLQEASATAALTVAGIGAQRLLGHW